MSFEQQQTGWSCGLAALKYAYSLLGGGLRHNEEIDEQHIRIKARKSRWRVFRDGTSEDDIVRAAKKLGLTGRIRRYRKRDPVGVLAAVRAATKRGHVVIACVYAEDEPFFHWMVVASVRGARAIVFDPAVADAGMDERSYWLADPSGDYVPGLMKTKRLQKWLDPGDHLAEEVAEEYGEQHMFIEVSIAPRHRERFVSGMVDEALVRRMRRDLDVAASFDEYIDDLRDIFGHRDVRRASVGEPAYRFLRRQRERLVELTRSWVLPAACDEATVRRELENLEAICRCYRFVVRKGEEQAAFSQIGFWLGWTSATCAYGVEKFAA